MSTAWTRDPLRLLIATAAAYRITRLAQRDSLPPLPQVRQNLVDRWGDKPASELIDCPWCLGFWTSLAVFIAASSSDRAWRLLTPLAMSTAVGFLAGRDDD